MYHLEIDFIGFYRKRKCIHLNIRRMKTLYHQLFMIQTINNITNSFSRVKQKFLRTCKRQICDLYFERGGIVVRTYASLEEALQLESDSMP